MKRANEWTRGRLAAWGLPNARLESWGPFGRGWTLERSALHMLTPHQVPLMALPEAWTPGTAGPVRGKLMRIVMGSEADFETHKGTLAGAILLLEAPRELTPRDQPLLKRYSEQELEALAQFELPSDRRAAWRQRLGRRRAFRKSLRRFLAEEGVVALLSPSSRDGGTLRPTAGGTWEMEAPQGVPSLVLAAEHYNWLVRLLERELDVELEVDVSTTFHEDDPMAYNTVAEIPGSGRAPEIVMLGGHLDSWHAGTGATDNAAGCAVAMEAMRILQALGVKPRRTIRVALWSGEEQGLLGSRAYVARHFASRPDPEDPVERSKPHFLWSKAGRPLTLKPDHARLSAYFNLDNGTGKVRGVHLQENAAAAPIFESWMKPLADLGVTTLTMRNTRGTDHLAFDSVGLPGFQFIQDELDYETQTHHTNLDVYDHLQRKDLMQASVVMASFVYHAAMREERLPRKPLPKDEPTQPAPEQAAAGHAGTHRP